MNAETFAHDSNGNLTSASFDAGTPDPITISYDFANRVSSVAQSNKNTSYGYQGSQLDSDVLKPDTAGGTDSCRGPGDAGHSGVLDLSLDFVIPKANDAIGQSGQMERGSGMDDAKWERWAAATGIAFVVLALITFFMVPAPPKLDAPVGKIVDYYVKHRTAQALSFYIGALAFVVLFLWFLGSLRSFLMRAEGSPGRLSAVAFGAGLIFIAVVAVAALAAQTLTLGAAASGNEALIRALYVAANVGFSAVSFPIAVLAAATSLVVLRTKALPQWYGQVGAIVSLLFLGLGGVVTRSSGAFSPTGVFGLIGFLLFLVWTLVTSILLVQRLGKAAASAPMASAPPV